VATGAGGALVSTGESSFAGSRGAGARLVRFVDALHRTPRQRNHDWRLAMTAGQIRGLATPEGQAFFGEPSFYGADVDLPLPLNEALLLDLERYLPDDILVKLDIASMAHGLEARCPFLDQQLLEYAASLPGRLKLGRADGRGAGGGAGGRAAGGALPGPPWRASSKLVLRHALRRILPADVLAGGKRGFGVPLEHWFRGPLLAHAREVLLSPAARSRGLFRPAAVEALLDDHAQNRVAAHEPLFTLLVLERWFLSEDSRC
ncbi:MAG TPA: asparagine synthase C-terminal domain-containing protein, partial [Planctomycetota bacterium]|nr:asparagine synthase C-terminal domain-containing protein [Planctomycetota bacterium]